MQYLILDQILYWSRKCYNGLNWVKLTKLEYKWKNINVSFSNKIPLFLGNAQLSIKEEKAMLPLNYAYFKYTHTQWGRYMSTNDNAKWANMLTVGDVREYMGALCTTFILTTFLF